MSYDESLADRVRQTLLGRAHLEERAMFGGLAFMVNGHMAVGVMKNDLMVRVGKQAWPDTVGLPGAREMTFTGKSMKTMVFVEPSALRADEHLHAWVERGVSFVLTLPPKKGTDAGR